MIESTSYNPHCKNVNHQHRQPELKPIEYTPPGYRLMGTAYTNDEFVFILGDVDDDDESHDCDDNGCGWEHVLARFTLATK